jgi:hypothetical protein
MFSPVNRARATLELRRRNFRSTYRDDPVAFVHDCFHWPEGDAPTDYQDEVLSELWTQKRAAVRGPHGLGKTALASWAIIWFALTRDGEDWKIPTTASAWRQLTKFLWPEIARKWAPRLDWEKLGRSEFQPNRELQTLSLRLGGGEAFAVASDNHELIEGAHADHILYVFDESKAIPDATFDAAEGAFSGPGEAVALAISTPGAPSGRFYDIHKRKPGYEDWWVRHVTLEESIQAGRISGDWAEQRKRQWGEKSSVYLNRVLGEFAADDEEGLIPLSWVEQANQRWHDWNDGGRRGSLTVIGVDVARSGKDETVRANRYGQVIGELERTVKEDTMQTAGRVVSSLKANPGAYAVIDVIGLGAGVVDRVNEILPGSAYEFNASVSTEYTDESGFWRFNNLRSYGWYNLRDQLDPNLGHDIALPPEDGLTGDLTSPRYKVMSGGKIAVESKDNIKKRLGRSPDAGDAVVHAFCDDLPSETLLFSSWED